MSCFDYALDIHSTGSTSDPMIVACRGIRPELFRGFPVDVVLTNIEQVQLAKPAVFFYGERGKAQTVGLEAGSHEETRAFECAIECSLAMLRNVGLVDGEHSSGHGHLQEYRIDGSLIYSHPGQELSREFQPFERLSAGETMLAGNGTSVHSAFGGHAIMPPKGTDRSNRRVGEEAMLLSRPVRELHLEPTADPLV